MTPKNGLISTAVTAARFVPPSDPTQRPDQPERVNAHAGKYAGGVALVVLGGSSGGFWEQVRDAVRPDVILTANGATRLPGADYWMLTENMNHCHTRAGQGDKYLEGFLHVLDPENTAENLFISHRSWNLLGTYGIDERRCTAIRRADPGDLSLFNLRAYGLGFLAGPLSEARHAWKPGVKVRLGTVGAQLLHLAGILGCAEVHTVGFDLLFADPEHHHWYQHPRYETGIFRTPQMFVEYKGAATQAWWVETARWLKEIEWIFERDGLRWVDHSGGLLAIEGLQCAR